MNIIYDERTPHSRLMVGYDRQGVWMREWSDDCGEGETGFHVHEGTYSWARFRARERSYSGDDGSGNLKKRMVAGAISLMGNLGPDSDSCGTVKGLSEYLNGAHVFNC